MHRSDFAPWGQDLDELGFWRAAALLGMISVSRGTPPIIGEDAALVVQSLLDTLPGGSRLDDQPGPGWMIDDEVKARARRGELMPAGELAGQWDRFMASGRMPCRMGTWMLFDNQVEFATMIHSWLMLSLILPLNSTGAGSDWQWPLRFLLPDGAGYEGLRRQFAGLQARSDTVRRLARGLDWQASPVVEFLVLRGRLESAIDQVESAPLPIRAHCLLLLDALPLDTGRNPFESVDRLHQLTRCHGIVASATTEGQFEDWIRQLVHELSHDKPLDHVLRAISAAPPLMFFSPELFRLSRIGRFAERTGLALTLAGAAEVDLHAHEADPIHLPAGRHTAANVGASLASTLREPYPFHQEIRGATWTTNLLHAARRSGVMPMSKPARETQSERRVQVDVWVEGELTDRFRAGCEHFIDVFIGAEGGLFSGAPFPEELLPDDEAGHLLTVTIYAPGFLEAPRVETLYLPRTGDSRACRFPVSVGYDRPWFEARLSVAYRNRTLQTHLLRGSVAGLQQAQEQPIDLVPEMATQSSLNGLDGQRDYGATIQINRLGDGKALTLQSGYQALAFSIEGLDDEMNDIERRIDASSWDSPTMRGLTGPGSRVLLHFLSQHGASLLEAVKRYGEASPAGQRLLDYLLGAKLVQVMAANLGARLPVEFFYDNDSPDDDAAICPNHDKAIGTTECSDCPHRGTRHFCPAALWSLNRAIEWHQFETAVRRIDEIAPRTFAIESPGQASARDRLRTITDVVVGVSPVAGKQDPECVPNMVRAIVGLGVRTHEATSWDDLDRLMDKHHPGLLVLLPHLQKNSAGMETLEICGSARNALQIGKMSLGVPPASPGPVVLLIGCNTDNAGAPFRSFPVALSRRAAIVVATISHLLGRHAAPLAAQLAEAIIGAQRSSDPTHPAFGDVMRAARRAGLGEDMPPVTLTLKCYGDARWCC